jgi:hypothetical protein
LLKKAVLNKTCFELFCFLRRNDVIKGKLILLSCFCIGLIFAGFILPVNPFHASPAIASLWIFCFFLYFFGGTIAALIIGILLHKNPQAPKFWAWSLLTIIALNYAFSPLIKHFAQPFWDAYETKYILSEREKNAPKKIPTANISCLQPSSGAMKVMRGQHEVFSIKPPFNNLPRVPNIKASRT